MVHQNPSKLKVNLYVWQNHSKQRVMNEIEEFLKKISAIESNNRTKQEKEDAFNIFTALHKFSDEVNLHSRFIAFLLSDSRHGMKQLFLKLFIENILKIKFDINNCEVIPNEYQKGEFKEIDILIINRITKVAIIIENKIYASDSNHSDAEDGYKGQLERYYNIIKKELGIDTDEIGKEKIKLFYLTLDRHMPTTASVGMLKYLDNWSCIDYGKEIIQWLQLCEEESTNKPILKEIIGHYIKLINNMTENQLNIEDRIKLQKLIGSSEENMRNTKLLIDNFQHVKWHTIADFWNELAAKLSVNHVDVNQEKCSGDITQNSITFQVGGVTFYIANDKNNALTYGIHKENKTIDDWSEFELCEDEKIILTHFNHKGTFNLINPIYRSNIIDKLVFQISEFITQKIGRK